jgi:HD-like signal output (HDOD) protein
MLYVGFIIAGAMSALFAWVLLRRPRGSAAPLSGIETERVELPATLADCHVETLPVAGTVTANSLAAERLWNLAFTAIPEAPIDAVHTDISREVVAALRAKVINPAHLPRRPTLMPQLLRAMEDPRAASDKLSRIVAHDPVLTADVLRLANSSIFRTSKTPIETLQKAIIVLGADALRGLLATAMLQPVFRATRTNFPRFPRMLWERTERAARICELFALQTRADDRFEAQLTALLSALGPLAVYGATLDVYARHPDLVPNPNLCVELINMLGNEVSVRIARDWESSERIIDALQGKSAEPLAQALSVGELLATLSLLQSQRVVEAPEAAELARMAGIQDDMLHTLSACAA